MPGYIPPSITDDIIEFVEHYGMVVSKTNWNPGGEEFQMVVESNTPMKWESVMEMIEYEFGLKVYAGRFDYQDDYTVTLYVYP